MINKLIITSYSDLTGMSLDEIADFKNEILKWATCIPSIGEEISTHVAVVGIDTTREQTRIQYDYIKV